MGGGCCIGNCCVGVAVSNIIEKVKDFFSGSSGSSSGSRTSSYDADKASLEETVRVQKALTEFKTDTEARSSALEKAIIKESRGYLDEFLDEIRKYNKIRYGGRCLNINLENIERENRKTEDKIHGFITKKVSKRISLDDDECKNILKMDAGTEKKKKLDQFYRKVLTEALSELTNILRKAMEQQTDIVEDRIQQRIDAVLETCEAKAADFKQIQKLKNKDENKIEQEQFRLSYMVAMCEYGLSFVK